MVSCLKVPSATSTAYAPDAILFTPLSPPVRGVEAIRRHDDGIRSAFPGARLTISRPVVRGQHTAVEWEYRGTNEGPIVLPAGVMAPTNQTVSLRGASFLRFTSEGLIAEEHRYFDVCSLLEQLAVA